jgi:hypothetical protein
VARGLVLAWLAGLGLMTWRELATVRKPPSAGRYAAGSGVFILLGFLSAYDPARAAAVLAAWGFDLAIFLQVLPEQAGAAGGRPGPVANPPSARSGGQITEGGG